MTFKTPEQREIIYNTLRKDGLRRANEEIQNLDFLIEQDRRKERAHRVLNPKNKRKF